MNKLKTAFKSAGIALKGVLITLALVLVLTSIKVSFFLMNLASTVGNIVGLLLLIFTIVFTFSTLLQITKYYNEQ